MKTSSRGSPDDLDRPEDLGAREMRACPVCGAKISATEANESCPVCMLRKTLASRAESGASLARDTVSPPPEQCGDTLRTLEIVLNEEGKPLELGRGAMGVTYKAFDVDLRCPVTLKGHQRKVSQRRGGAGQICAGSACRRERPTSQRCLCLPPWERGQDYFYAMEFVEGGTRNSPVQSNLQESNLDR